MTDDEWAAIRLLLTRTFVRTEAAAYDRETDAAYRMSLAEYDPARILAGIKQLQREGQRFLPPVADIIGRIEGDPTVPGWTEMLAALKRCWSGGRSLARRAGEAPSDGHVLQWLAENVHPWAAAWAAEYGVGALRVAPIAEGEYAALERDRLRGQWEEWTHRAKEREAAGVPITAGAIRRHLGARRFDPVAALGLGRPELGSG